MSKNTIASYAPTVSVICHTYNHQPYIRHALEGMLMQETDFPVEIIVHDDASTDHTPDIIRELGTRHANRIVPILQKVNQLSRGKRPKLFTYPRARGDFIALCEGDDYWTDPEKLQKQVDALRRHPEVDLCVHPAMRLSMRTGKLKVGFNHANKRRIFLPNAIIARHDQFAPTASMMLRTSEVRQLPEWFFSEPGPPVGDCFTEAILGRKGVLYLPDIMSVYRRGVPGSYTRRFECSGGQELEETLARMLYFTEKLRGMEGIPYDALDQRLSYIRLNYALQFLAVGDRDRFNQVSREIVFSKHKGLRTALASMRQSRLAFSAGRMAFRQLRRYKA